MENGRQRGGWGGGEELGGGGVGAVQLLTNNPAYKTFLNSFSFNLQCC